MADEQLAMIERFVKNYLGMDDESVTEKAMKSVVIEAIQRWEAYKNMVGSYQGGY